MSKKSKIILVIAFVLAISASICMLYLYEMDYNNKIAVEQAHISIATTGKTVNKQTTKEQTTKSTSTTEYKKETTTKQYKQTTMPVTIAQQQKTKQTEPQSSYGYSIPSGASSFKTYMDYRCITCGAQYSLQQQAYTDGNGIRKVGDYYCVALGSYYGSTIGTKYKITLSGGKSFLAILGDQKANCDTNSTHQYSQCNGDIIEFIVDTGALPACVRTSGSVSSIGMFSGSVTAIERI